MKLAVLLGMLSLAGLARADSFTGYLADAKCAKAGKAASAGHSGCAKKCVEGGEAIVLVGEDGKIYQIKNQDKAKPHVGFHVELQATREGDTLDVQGGKHLD
jgi:hypothetical protein